MDPIKTMGLAASAHAGPPEGQEADTQAEARRNMFSRVAFTRSLGVQRAYSETGRARLTVEGRPDLENVIHAIHGGVVLTLLDVVRPLREGRLLRLLPDWEMGLLDIWAVTPQRDAQPAKVRQAIAELQAYFAQLDGTLR